VNQIAQNMVLPKLTDRQFIWRLVLVAWLFRLAIVIVLQATDAIFILRLSPDSERYHREGILVAEQMALGNFNWPAWIDDAWFQFTGLIYWLIGPYDWIIQLINITFGALIVVPLYHVFRYMTDDVVTQRFYALLVAFFPSLVYWSVLMLKDPASTLAMAMVVYAVFTMRIRFTLLAVLCYVAGMLIFLGTRTYLFFVIGMLTAPALLIFPYRPEQHTFRILILAVLAGFLPMLLGFGYFGVNYITESKYFDLDYINHVRRAMGDHGSGAIFDQEDVHVWGKSVTGDIVAAIQTVFAVFVPVNPFDVGSTRQLIALPFVLVMMYLMWPMMRGVRYAWRIRQLSAPVAILTVGVLAVYVSGTTNVGALFRWTTQIMPLFLMPIAIGFFYRPQSFTHRIGWRLTRAWV